MTIVRDVNMLNLYYSETYLRMFFHPQQEQVHQDKHNHIPQGVLNSGDICEYSYHCHLSKDLKLRDEIDLKTYQLLIYVLT